jgi:hypothetical protein
MKRLASPVIWRGILAIGVGVIAVAWPAITIWAFVILFAAYAFLAADIETARASGLRSSVRLPGTSPGQESRRSRSPSRCGVGVHHRFLREVPCLRQRADRRPAGAARVDRPDLRRAQPGVRDTARRRRGHDRRGVRPVQHRLRPLLTRAGGTAQHRTITRNPMRGLSVTRTPTRHATRPCRPRPNKGQPTCNRASPTRSQPSPAR